MFQRVILNRIFVNETFLSTMVCKEAVDIFHPGSVPWFDELTTHHEIPRTVRDCPLGPLGSMYLPRRGLSLGDPRANDRSITREAGERYFVRDAFGYVLECIVAGTLPPSMSSMAESDNISG